MPEPFLLFHPERTQDRSRHPLHGLVNYGPYSQALLNQVRNPIRVAMIAPAGELGQIDRLLSEIEQAHNPIERTNYLVRYLGFSRIFRVPAVSAAPIVRLELPRTLDDEVARAAQPMSCWLNGSPRRSTRLGRAHSSSTCL